MEYKNTSNNWIRRCFILCLLCAFTGIDGLNAATFSIPGTNITLSYTVASGEVTISDCNTDADGSVIIPSSIEGMPVVGIKVNAFFACKYIDSVDIPASVSSIGVAPFEDCSELLAINVSPSNPNYSSVDGVLFDKTIETLIEFPHGKSGTYIIPNTVKVIEYFAFSDSDLLTGVVLPSGLETVGRYAFYRCELLDNVTIPSTVSLIREYAFSGCKGLETLVLESGVSAIDRNAFSDCDALVSVTVPGSVSSFGDFIFSSCDNLETVTFLDGITTIPRYMFNYCRKLATVNLPSSLLSIEIAAFADCTSLESITLPEGLERLGQSGGSVFRGSGILSISIPSTVTDISNETFWNCQQLQSIEVSSANTVFSSLNGVLFNKEQTALLKYPAAKSGPYVIPNGVIDLPDSAFAGCKELTAITIPYGVTEISDSFFSGCEKLLSIDLPNSVTRIGHWSFYGCTALETISIAASVVDIYGASSFQGCTGIVSFSVDSANPNYTSEDGVLFNKNQTELIMCPARKAGDYTIPAAVSTIDYYYSFLYCDELKNIFVHPSNAIYQSIDGVVFNESETELLIFPRGRSGTYVVPAGVVTLGSNSFLSSRNLTRVVIPEGVTTIERGVFLGCRGLEEVVIPKSVRTIGIQAFDGARSLEVIFMGDAPNGIDSYSGISPSSAYYFEGATGFPEPSPYWWDENYNILSVKYSAWMDSAFVSGAWTLHQRLPDRDPDGDSMANLLEYAFMTDPTSTGSAGLLSASSAEDVSGAIQVSFNLREGATDITYALKASGGLQAWPYYWQTVATYTPNGTTSGFLRSVNSGSDYELIGDVSFRLVDESAGLYEMNETISIGAGSAFFKIEIVQ